MATYANCPQPCSDKVPVERAQMASFKAEAIAEGAEIAQDQAATEAAELEAKAEADALGEGGKEEPGPAQAVKEDKTSDGKWKGVGNQ
ncbi:hypothetical protein MMC17_005587 [Xylographa soralifera]|nr:hypothetical protein [Xylographa soralifera]